MIKNQNGRRAYSAEDHVIITALLMLQPRWSQTFFTQALNVKQTFVSDVKTKAIRLGIKNAFPPQKVLNIWSGPKPSMTYFPMLEG